MNSYSDYCDDSYLYCHLNTEMDLPTSRDTVLHFFGQVGKAFPSMSNFYTRETNEFVLEEDKESGSYRWMTLESRRLSSGYLNPPSLDACHKQHELMLQLAPHLLGVTAMDCEALDVIIGFDFTYKGNHDAILGEVFGTESKFESLITYPKARVVDFEPTITIALDENCRMQARLSLITRTNSYQVRTGQYQEEPISVYFTVRQYWTGTMGDELTASYHKQVEVATDLVDKHIVPNVVVPLQEALSR